MKKVAILCSLAMMSVSMFAQGANNEESITIVSNARTAQAAQYVVKNLKLVGPGVNNIVFDTQKGFVTVKYNPTFANPMSIAQGLSKARVKTFAVYEGEKTDADLVTLTPEMNCMVGKRCDKACKEACKEACKKAGKSCCKAMKSCCKAMKSCCKAVKSCCKSKK